ncbi:hypothetical protein PIB30_019367 [Stylosanthes scabra]|uniref:Uncharacterized protein n=1 Tax=Stylosanthes scabra TaxID=79078 RepID=A0ABU6Y594_9FABA|nr:hypothetical protein [Stylosanthes scabra]
MSTKSVGSQSRRFGAERLTGGGFTRLLKYSLLEDAHMVTLKSQHRRPIVLFFIYQVPGRENLTETVQPTEMLLRYEARERRFIISTRQHSFSPPVRRPLTSPSHPISPLIRPKRNPSLSLHFSLAPGSLISLLLFFYAGKYKLTAIASVLRRLSSLNSAYTVPLAVRLCYFSVAFASFSLCLCLCSAVTSHRFCCAAISCNPAALKSHTLTSQYSSLPSCSSLNSAEFTPSLILLALFC